MVDDRNQKLRTRVLVDETTPLSVDSQRRTFRYACAADVMPGDQIMVPRQGADRLELTTVHSVARSTHLSVRRHHLARHGCLPHRRQHEA